MGKGKEEKGGNGKEGEGAGIEVEFPYFFNPTLTTGTVGIFL